MASHEELIAEVPKLEKMSNAARLKLAKKRRLKQLKKNQELTRRERETGQYVAKPKCTPKINFINVALLHEAVIRNDLPEVESLLKKGVNPNPSNADGLTPLHRCCIENTVKMAKLLLDYGTERDARDVEGWTPLHAASACGNLTMINLLIENGASMVALNHDDKMPVDVACDGDIRYVIQQKMLEGGYTDDVCVFIRASIPKTMLADLKEGAKTGRSVNIQDKYGATALHVAAANGYIEVLEFLLEQPDIKVDIQDNEGWTPFHAAVCWEQKEVMEMLAKQGVDLEKEDIHGDTPFAVSDNAEIRQYIIELKGQFTKPVHESVSPGMDHLRASMEDDLMSTEERGRKRSLSARRSSVQVRDGMKKINAQAEKKMMDTSMDNEDMVRTISGEVLDKDIPLSPTGISLEGSLSANTCSSANTTPSVIVKETPIDRVVDGELEDVEEALDGTRRDRRRKLKSVLKSTRPTPLVKEEGGGGTVDNTFDSTKSDNFRVKPPPSSPGRDCCTIL